MPSIKVKENEPFDIAIRRFRRACEKAGVLTEIRKRAVSYTHLTLPTSDLV